MQVGGGCWLESSWKVESVIWGLKNLCCRVTRTRERVSVHVTSRVGVFRRRVTVPVHGMAFYRTQNVEQAKIFLDSGIIESFSVD